MATSGSLRTASPLVVSYSGLVPDRELIEWVSSGAVSGVVLFRDNCVDASALRDATLTLQTTSPGPFYIMIDEEGGRVRRLPDGPESMRDLRDYQTATPEDIADRYRQVAMRLRSLGIDTLLAPVVDVGNDDAGWLNSRTLSHDPADVAAMAAGVIPAIQSADVHACAKHFPGTGRVLLDPHHGPVRCAINKSDWSAHERIPFASAIEAGVEMVLIGHQVMQGFGRTVPACFDREIVTNLLRNEMRFHGLALTDDLSMGAVAETFEIEDAVGRAIDAGCDCVLVCNIRESQRRAVEYWARRSVVA